MPVGVVTSVLGDVVAEALGIGKEGSGPGRDRVVALTTVGFARDDIAYDSVILTSKDDDISLEVVCWTDTIKQCR